MRAKSSAAARTPALSRESLALKLRQNWIDRHPTEAPSGGLDDSLTSLNWLQNLNIMKLTAPTPPSSPPSALDDQPTPRGAARFSSCAQVNPNAVLDMTHVGGVTVKQEQEPLTTNGHFRAMAGIEMTPTTIAPLDNIDYKTNAHIKPPYSYATLICMAMRDSQKKKITLSGIYNWITENFMYYKMADPSWQNSIRHNLSLNKCFQKVARRKDEPGKGGFWRINPEYEDMFVNGIFKKRRCSALIAAPGRADGHGPPPLKKIKQESDDSNGSMSSLSGLAMAGALPSLLTPMNSVDETQSAVQSIEVKREQTHDVEAARPTNVVVDGGSGGDVSDAIDFSWNAILNQDIDVGGVKVKTEDIIDRAEGAASPITALSPPDSVSGSSEISLDDLLNADFGNDVDNPLDLTNGSALDLTISGIGLRAPEWWEESLNGRQFLNANDDERSRMSTPVASVDDEDFAHPWAEEKSDSEMAMASFDKHFSNLFEIMDNLGSPKMSTDS